MAQQILPSDKTVRIPVKLVTMAGDELPFRGFMLVPEDRMILFERLAAAARDLLARHENALKDASQGERVKTAVKALGNVMSELEKVWDIPQ
jgi:hypothetical protein